MRRRRSLYRLQPIRRRKAGLSSQEGGSRAAADTEAEEAGHARGGVRGGKVEVGRQRDAAPQYVCLRGCQQRNSSSSHQGP